MPSLSVEWARTGREVAPFSRRGHLTGEQEGAEDTSYLACRRGAGLPMGFPCGRRIVRPGRLLVQQQGEWVPHPGQHVQDVDDRLLLPTMLRAVDCVPEVLRDDRLLPLLWLTPRHAGQSVPLHIKRKEPPVGFPARAVDFADHDSGGRRVRRHREALQGGREILVVEKPTRDVEFVEMACAAQLPGGGDGFPLPCWRNVLSSVARPS